MPFTFGPIVETLIYYDGPLLFTVRDTVQQKLHLVTWYDCDDQHHRYLAIEVSDARLEAFTKGEIDYFDMFNVNPLYAVDYAGEQTVVTRISMSQIPRDTMAKTGATLVRDEE